MRAAELRRRSIVVASIASIASVLVMASVIHATLPNVHGAALATRQAVRGRPEDVIVTPDANRPVIAGDPVPADHRCPATGRAAVADKAAQRFWLCVDGRPVTGARPMTTGAFTYGLPPVGTYRVFAKLRWNTGIHGETLERFVAFYRTPRNNRIAFHEVVHQDPVTVGDPDRRGASAGCFRLIESDSVLVWDFLQIGDPVIVITR